MRNVMKAATLESKFPILSVEHDCIISKDADITVCYRVELPELFTVTQAEYEATHSAWAKAVKVLPNYSIVHKQDFFIEESYTPELTNEARAEASSLDYALQGGRRQSQLQKEDLSFLSRSFERHFNERPYLKHTCYLFLTKTTKEHSRTTSSFNALTRGFIIPKEMQDKEVVSRFLECCEQFERIINDSGFITLTRLTGDRLLHDGSTLLAKDAFIYGGAITLELESYITDRIVLLANVRERVLWGGSLGKFSTQFGLGVKFIIN